MWESEADDRRHFHIQVADTLLSPVLVACGADHQVLVQVAAAVIDAAPAGASVRAGLRLLQAGDRGPGSGQRQRKGAVADGRFPRPDPQTRSWPCRTRSRRRARQWCTPSSRCPPPSRRGASRPTSRPPPTPCSSSPRRRRGGATGAQRPQNIAVLRSTDRYRGPARGGHAGGTAGGRVRAGPARAGRSAASPVPREAAGGLAQLSARATGVAAGLDGAHVGSDMDATRASIGAACPPAVRALLRAYQRDHTKDFGILWRAFGKEKADGSGASAKARLFYGGAPGVPASAAAARRMLRQVVPGARNGTLAELADRTRSATTRPRRWRGFSRTSRPTTRRRASTGGPQLRFAGLPPPSWGLRDPRRRTCTT